MTEPVLYEQHMHTPLCKHARGEPGDYAAVAEQRGLKGIVVTWNGFWQVFPCTSTSSTQTPSGLHVSPSEHSPQVSPQPSSPQSLSSH